MKAFNGLYCKRKSFNLRWKHVRTILRATSMMTTIDVALRTGTLPSFEGNRIPVYLECHFSGLSLPSQTKVVGTLSLTFHDHKKGHVKLIFLPLISLSFIPFSTNWTKLCTDQALLVKLIFEKMQESKFKGSRV